MPVKNFAVTNVNPPQPDMENNNEDRNSKHDVMVSNLPLLFSDGNPTSLEVMTVEDLQYFVPFLMKCILGAEPANWVKYPQLKWWPLDVPWSPIILSKKYQTLYWGKKLQQLVKRCYEYNGCSYLLQFSAKLQQMRGDGFKYTDNWDGTTSMYESKSGKLLVTFRNENMVYDRLFRQQSCASRPMLLPRLNSPNSPVKLISTASNEPSLPPEAPSTAQMVEPPVCDIFLCDYCGADFDTLSAIKTHEAQCMTSKAQEAYANSNVIEAETKDLDQAKFLWYLSLTDRSKTKPPNVTPAKIYPVSKKSFTLSDRRYTTIQFSSNLGQSFFKMSKLSLTTSESLVDRYERYCVAKPRVGRGPLRGSQLAPTPAETTNHIPSYNWPVSFRRPNVLKRKDEWTHIYSFNKQDRKERLKTISTGLTKRSRQLYRQCRNLRVVLRRLTPESIEYWTRPKPKQPLLQPWLQRSIASLPPNCTISLAPAHPSSSQLHRNLSPSLVITRPGGETHQLLVTRNKSLPVKPRTRSPPPLLPLITSAWSMKTKETVEPKNNPLFILPDLIPVNRNCKSRPPEPVVIRMPSILPANTAITSLQPAKTSMPSRKNVVLVDLVSSGDDLKREGVMEQAIEATLPPSFIIPPGISITKVEPKAKSSPVAGSRDRKADISRPAEQNNNRTRNVSEWIKSAATLGSTIEVTTRNADLPPALKFMGPNSRIQINSETSITPRTSLTAVMADDPAPIVTPLKLAKLPAAKREQMKQSLLKIQQKEGKSPSKSPPLPAAVSTPRKEPPVALPPAEELVQLSAVTTPSSKRDLNNILSDECKELKDKGLGDLLHSGQRITRRKRPKEDENEDNEVSTGESQPSAKIPKIKEEPLAVPQLDEDDDDDDDYPAIIEVDLAGPGSDVEGVDSSKDGSSRSLTPDSHGRRRMRELSQLLSDECKELRRKGLENLTHSNQRVTRCRTKSAPVAKT